MCFFSNSAGSNSVLVCSDKVFISLIDSAGISSIITLFSFIFSVVLLISGVWISICSVTSDVVSTLDWLFSSTISSLLVVSKETSFTVWTSLLVSTIVSFITSASTNCSATLFSFVISVSADDSAIFFSEIFSIVESVSSSTTSSSESEYIESSIFSLVSVLTVH